MVDLPQSTDDIFKWVWIRDYAITEIKNNGRFTSIN